jgi:hypothetical protein
MKSFFFSTIIIIATAFVPDFFNKSDYSDRLINTTANNLTLADIIEYRKKTMYIIPFPDELPDFTLDMDILE